MAMPYLIWSLWVQCRILKQYCVLCIFVQIVIWLIGLIDCYCVINVMENQNYGIVSFVLIGSLLILIVQCVHFVADYLTKKNELVDCNQKFKSFKSDKEIFFNKLKKKECIDSTNQDSNIVFGNNEAQWHITILSNPHCNPCTRMHSKIDTLLNMYPDMFEIRYIFTSFSRDYYNSSKFMIAAYQNYGPLKAKDIYKQWFSGGVNHYEEFIQSYGINIETVEVNDEWQKHRKWVKESGLSSTPTILVNGYELPEDYSIEDLITIE